MMPQDVYVPYEILVRFGDDGAFRGAHQIRQHITTLDDGRVFSEFLPAEALDLALAGDLLGEVTTRAAAAATAAIGERDTLSLELSATRIALEAMASERNSLLQQLATAQAERNEALAQLAQGSQVE